VPNCELAFTLRRHTSHFFREIRSFVIVKESVSESTFKQDSVTAIVREFLSFDGLKQ
jgi:hypothetical protein